MHALLHLMGLVLWANKKKVGKRKETAEEEEKKVEGKRKERRREKQKENTRRKKKKAKENGIGNMRIASFQRRFNHWTCFLFPFTPPPEHIILLFFFPGFLTTPHAITIFLQYFLHEGQQLGTLWECDTVVLYGETKWGKHTLFQGTV